MQIKKSLFLAIILIIISVNDVVSFKILGIFPYQGKSHFFVFEPYLHELVRRGHDVTVISYFSQKQPIQNYTDISLAGKDKIYEDIIKIDQSVFEMIDVFNNFLENGLENCKTLLANENVQQLWKSEEKFDLVLVEAFFTDCGLGLAHQFGAPIVALNSHVIVVNHYERFGIPHQFLQFGPAPNFLYRLGMTLMIESVKVLAQWSVQRNEEKILATYFDDLPPLEEIGREIKLMLAYTHPALFGPKAFPEIVKEVGGYHVAKAKQLPDKLRQFIEESEHGVIYISFGSMVKAATLPRHKLEAIIGAVSELPQRVVWKWEEETLPGNPKNIYVAKWLPQNDILAHPNVVAFYSHCGLLGTTEAIHHGVPIIAMPVFGDQFFNTMAVVEKGLGVQLPYSKLTKETLLENLRTVLDPEFSKRVQEISREWHDRPQPPMDAAVFWTEYAARHPRGSLRTPAVGMPGYQLAGLDVLFTLLCVLLAFVYTIKYLVFGRRKTKAKLE